MNQISYEERVEVYKEALKQYGQEMQMVVAIEELAECQKEICKVLRGKGILDHLAEEIADATIMLEQLRLMHDINELVCQEMDEKVERLSDRLGMREDEVNKETAKMIWVPMPGKEYSWKLTCGKCGYNKSMNEEHKYCPGCGAKFEGPPKEIPWRQEDGQND